MTNLNSNIVILDDTEAWEPHYTTDYSQKSEIQHVVIEKGYTPVQQDKIELIMREFKNGKLKSSSGDIVTDREQALAIAISEAKGVKKSEYTRLNTHHGHHVVEHVVTNKPHVMNVVCMDCNTRYGRKKVVDGYTHEEGYGDTHGVCHSCYDKRVKEILGGIIDLSDNLDKKEL